MPIEALIALVSLAAGLVADRRSSDETRANEGPSDDLVSRDMIPQAVMSRAREMLDHYGSRPWWSLAGGSSRTLWDVATRPTSQKRSGGALTRRSYGRARTARPLSCWALSAIMTSS